MNPDIWTPITADTRPSATPRQVAAPLGGRRWRFDTNEARILREEGLVEPDARVCHFASDEGSVMLCAIVAQHPSTGLWHLSVAHPDRDPSWAELSDARYRLCPDEAVMCMILPPMAEYTNVHQHCFHLYEVPEAGESNR